MAADTIGLIDALGFDKVHLVGASMGGMIAQTIAIEFPSRIKSLTSIMSTTGSLNIGQPDIKSLFHLGEPPYNDRQGYIDWRVKSLKAIGSPEYMFDEESTSRTAGLSWDRDHDPFGMMRQSVAVLKSGDRTSKLKDLKIPTLVIHGDSDKMVNVNGGIATADAIPNAKLKIFKGMGHGFPKELWNEMTNLITEHVKTSD
jgi:pimeloyl-ACP methyl ester carboxylesterase